MSEEKIDIILDMLKDTKAENTRESERRDKQMEVLFEQVRPIPVISERIQTLGLRVDHCENEIDTQGADVASIKEKQEAQENQQKGMKAGIGFGVLFGGSALGAKFAEWWPWGGAP